MTRCTGKHIMTHALNIQRLCTAISLSSKLYIFICILTYITICTYTHIYIYTCVCSYLYLSVSIYLLPVCLSVRPSVRPSIHPPIQPFFPVCLSVFLSFYPFALYVKLCETMYNRCTGRETHTHVRRSISTSSKILELCSSLLPATAGNQRNRPQPKSVIPQTSQAKTQDQPGTPKMCVANPKQNGLQQFSFPRFQNPNFHSLFEHLQTQVNSQIKTSHEDSTKTWSKELPTTLHQRSWRANTATHSRQIAYVSVVFLCFCALNRN